MAETIELSEAIRSILDEDGNEKEMNLDLDKQESTTGSSVLNHSILRNTTWDPRHAPGKSSGTFDKKRANASKPSFRSPPKKRRHINEVIILRNPRRKSKPLLAANTCDTLKRKADAPKNLEPTNRNGKTMWDSQGSQSSVTMNSQSSQESSDYSQYQEDIDLFDQKTTQDSNRAGIGDKFENERQHCSSKQQKVLAKRKPRDDGLTNITWLRRMSAAELDPQTLQTPKVTDPRLERPPYSYSTLIQFAISTAPSGRMTLREIYNWIEVHFPYFRTAKLGWRNSIRHNLSLHKIFIREPPVGHGQPAFWTLRPGTVVRLPEKTMFVAKKKSTQLSSRAAERRHQSHKQKASQKRSLAEHGAKADKKKEQYILPRPTQQPLALVPVPIFLSTDAGTQMVTSSATGEPILSPIPINLLPEAQLRSMFAPRQEASGQRKMVKIAPKATHSETPASQETSFNKSQNLQSNFPNATFSSSSILRDSGIATDGEGTFHESLVTSSSQDIFGSPPGRRHLPIKKRNSPWNKLTSSTPHGKANRSENERPVGEVPDFSIFDELPNFNFTPTKTPNRKSKRKLTTPSRSCAPCPDWLSPIRGLTPFKFGDDFTNLKDDMKVTPPRTGLTPKNRYNKMSSSSLSTPKSHRSPALGSLGDLGLSGLTPERISDMQNQSFSKIFGSDLSFEMDSDGFWSMMSPQ